jgi:hypothetical protein
MKTQTFKLTEVSLMQYSKDEQKVMDKLNAVWVLSMDLKHHNMLVYPIDIMVDKVEERCPRKFVNRDDFYEYTAENGSHWFISTSVTLEDLDLFFRNYLHLTEEGTIAA